MIGLVAREKMEWDIELPYVFETVITEAKGRIRNYFISRFDKLPTTLILVSSTRLGHREKEINNSILNYCVIFNSNLEINFYNFAINKIRNFCNS